MSITVANRVTPLLPAAPSAGTREAQMVTAVEDGAVGVRDLLMHDPSSVDEVGAAARALKQASLAATTTLSPEASAEAVRAASLAALQGGMMCGALDGLLMLCAHQVVTDPQVAVPAGLEGKRELLTAGMEKAREVGRDQWSTMPMDDLQLLAGYGKHQNLHTGDESQAVVGKPAATSAEWLMATFKAGYAIGVADAAIMSRGENPDPTV